MTTSRRPGRANAASRARGAGHRAKRAAAPSLRVLITAAATGIGKAIAERFVTAGARVHVCDVDDRALTAFRAALPAARATHADVGRSADVKRLVQEAVSWMGGLDVLVNNAGIAGPRGDVESITDADWDETLRVNVTGMFYCAREVVPLFKGQRSGCVINIATSSARVGLPQRLPYVVSKSAVLGLTLNLARELGPWNIRCNAVLPGAVEGQRLQRVVRGYARDHDVSEKAAMDQLLAGISMRTSVSPREIAEAVLFLSSETGRHISGQELAVDGHVVIEN